MTPQSEDSSFLRVVVQYYYLFAQATEALNSEKTSSSPSEGYDLAELDRRLHLWHTSLPHELQLQASFDSFNSVTFNRGRGSLIRQRLALFLRYNYLRTIINYDLFKKQGTLSGVDNAPLQIVASCCKESVLLLTHLHQNTNLYQKQRAIFNHFLAKAISVLFEISKHINWETAAQGMVFQALDLAKKASKFSADSNSPTLSLVLHEEDTGCASDLLEDTLGSCFVGACDASQDGWGYLLGDFDQCYVPGVDMYGIQLDAMSNLGS